MFENVWKLVLEHFTERQLYTSFPLIPSMILFWTISAFFVFFDLFPGLSPIYKWKIQPRSETPSKILLMVLTGLFNHFFVFLLSNYLYEFTKAQAPPYRVEELPNLWHLIAEIVLIAFMYDFGFYVTHRIMHIPWFYKNVHALHHSSRTPCVLAQVYFHPIDLVLSLLPVCLPPILLNSHIATKTLWNCVLIIESMNAHCGYHFPLMPDSRAHDFHHSHPHKPANFGAFFLVWDKLLGTDLAYKQHFASGLMETLEGERIGSSLGNGNGREGSLDGGDLQTAIEPETMRRRKRSEDDSDSNAAEEGDAIPRRPLLRRSS